MAGENPDETGLACEVLCLLAFAADIVDAITDLMSLLALCSLLVFPPAAFICAGIAFVLYFLAATKANEAYKDCLLDCGGGG